MRQQLIYSHSFDLFRQTRTAYSGSHQTPQNYDFLYCRWGINNFSSNNLTASQLHQRHSQDDGTGAKPVLLVAEFGCCCWCYCCWLWQRSMMLRMYHHLLIRRADPSHGSLRGLWQAHVCRESRKCSHLCQYWKRSEEADFFGKTEAIGHRSGPLDRVLQLPFRHSIVLLYIASRCLTLVKPSFHPSYLHRRYFSLPYRCQIQIASFSFV